MVRGADPDFDEFYAKAAKTSILKWMEPLDGRFYSQAYLLMFMELIIRPGMKKSELALFLENHAKVSRSTAERIIREAAGAKLIVIEDPPQRPGLHITLSDRLQHHFRTVFLESHRAAEGRLSEFDRSGKRKRSQ